MFGSNSALGVGSGFMARGVLLKALAAMALVGVVGLLMLAPFGASGNHRPLACRWRQDRQTIRVPEVRSGRTRKDSPSSSTRWRSTAAFRGKPL